MMQFDVAIIGSGIAGLTAGLRCIESGLKTVLISQGQSALHFSSGSIDVLAQTPNKKQINDPLAEIAHFAQQYPQHPYAKVGQKNVINALDWYQEVLQNNGVALKKQEDNRNHQRITPMGTLKSTWLSQPFVQQINDNPHPFRSIAMVAIDGYRDFQPQITLDNLAKHNDFKHLPMKRIHLHINAFQTSKRTCHEFRSIDISRILEQEQEFNHFADQLMAHANQDDLIIMPAVLGENLALMEKLQQATQLRFHEVPTMPPSLLGIRLENAMSHAFIQQGGCLLKGDQVLSGEFSQHPHGLQLDVIHTQNMTDMPIAAKHFVLASGSFFSKGLLATREAIIEPIFELDMVSVGKRAQWRDAAFFTKQHHPFMNFGVETDILFRPSKQQQTINNLFCAGSILAHYNPVVEGCGSGVAISTGYLVAQQIIDEQTLHQTTTSPTAEKLL